MDPNGQETKKPVEKLLDESDAIMLYLAPNGNVASCNKKAQELTGKSKAELIDRHWIDVLCNDSNADIRQQIFKAHLSNAMELRRVNIFEGSIVDSAKNEHVISWNMTPVSAESGALDGIFLLGNDVTLLKEREDSLRQIDDTLRNILSSIKEYALFAINLEGNITYYDMGFESMFGWRKKEVAFKHVGLLFQLEDAANKLPFILKQTKENGEYKVETNLVKKNGKPFPVVLHVNKFIEPGGKPVGYIFIAKDISEDKKIEYQIFQSEKMAAIGKLAAGMAHGINNPLFVISGRLQLLLDNKKVPRGVRKDLKTIEGQSERIRNIVDRFLTFSRKTSPNQEKADINKIINNVLPFLSYHKLPSHKIRIVKDFTDKLPPVKCDVHQLQEVFINLLINACQAMLEGGTLTIKTAKSENEFVRVDIADTGSGISTDDLKHMFIPFFSTKKEGTGLGLSICYNIIKNHNGSINVESELGKGTTFIIKLPFLKIRSLR